ncbi:MAG TPA: DUF2961 domain-containing protein [Prolixibacteraceae bacterium]|nr:DUF2961 domain-containing protein [Prolixibacteraceae bacterium]
MQKTIFWWMLALVALSSCSRRAVTLESLLKEMADREAIARYPDPEYTMKQFSSYDRATVAPGDHTWFANWDRSMFIRTDTIGGRQEYVMMDAEGPGAIVRFWMTFAGENSGRGILRIYFDGDTVPAIEGTAFDVLSGTLLTGAPLATSVSDSTEYEHRGHNLYLPLPYARRCLVTYESGNIKDPGAKTGGEAAYYNINYRTYSPGAKVTTWSREEMEKSAATLVLVQQNLASRDRGPWPAGGDSLTFTVSLAPGALRSDTLEGKKAIRMIRVEVDPAIDPQALRSTVLKIAFDGEATVWCPLGDFFGTGYQLRHSDTWYSAVDPAEGVLTAWRVMPFKEQAVITLENFGKETVEIRKVTLYACPWKWDRHSMHFGTSWHQFTRLETGNAKENDGRGGPSDINYVELGGKGVYAGDGVAVFNTMYGWWGEGDEKVYVDGETFPSHIGTGTEDYYGYAWCRPEKFANHPFIAQPDGSGNFWPGYTVNLRQRGLDAIPFTTSLRFDMEMWHWNKATIHHAPVTWYYVMPGSKSNILPDTAGVQEPVALRRSDIISPWIRKGRMEGESMVLGGASRGNFEYQNIPRFKWSEDMQAFWNGGKPGDHLDLLFYSADSLMAPVTVAFTHAPDYGTFRLELNGKPLPGQHNLFNEEVTTHEISLGTLPILKGRNQLRAVITGTSGNQGKAFFGIDYLLAGNQ